MGECTFDIPNKALEFALVKSTWGRGISVSTWIIVLTVKPDHRSFPYAYLYSWKGGEETFPTHLRTSETMLKWQIYSTNSAAPQSVIQTNTIKSVEYLNVSRFASSFEDMRTFVMPVRPLGRASINST